MSKENWPQTLEELRVWERFAASYRDSRYDNYRDPLAAAQYADDLLSLWRLRRDNVTSKDQE